MRPLATAVSLAIVACNVPTARAQSLNDRVTRAPDGAIRMSFATRAGVCGDGEFIGEDTPGGFRTYTIQYHTFSISTYEHVQPACRTGPLRLVIEKSRDGLGHLLAAVGVEWRAGGIATDLGTVSGAEAARWLVDLATRLPSEHDARVALLAASLADSARIAERMIAIATDKNLPAVVRTPAMWWLRGPAEREGLVDRADRAFRAIAGDASERTSLREQALRRLAESRSADNRAWLRDLALDTSAPLALRERALRTLGEEAGHPELVRSLYPRLDQASLKERAVRIVGEQRDEAAADWLRQLAESSAEPSSVRERAIRLLGERGETRYLRSVYPRLDRMDLKERVIRMAAESGRPDALEWVRGIVLDGGEPPALRERAVRELAGRGATSADLIQLYDRVADRQVRGRLIRIFGERGDRAALDKLAAIVRDDPDPTLRRSAQRRIAERAGSGVR